MPRSFMSMATISMAPTPLKIYIERNM